MELVELFKDTFERYLDEDLKGLYSFSKESFPHRQAAARVTNEYYQVEINIDWYLNEVDHHFEVLVVAYHESRHAYQIHQVGKYLQNLPTDEPKHIIQRWDEELKNSRPFIGINMDDYLIQHIEVDAMAFSYLVMDDLYGARVKLEGGSRDPVLKRVEELRQRGHRYSIDIDYANFLSYESYQRQLHHNFKPLIFRLGDF